MKEEKPKEKETIIICPECDGAGHIKNKRCEYCNGKGEKKLKNT